MNKLKCLRERCGHEWYPRTETPPAACPKCNSRLWNQEQTVPNGRVLDKLVAWLEDTDTLVQELDQMMNGTDFRDLVLKKIKMLRRGK